MKEMRVILVYMAVFLAGAVAVCAALFEPLRGAFVANHPISPEDILATMYHLKGIAPETAIPDRLGKPTRLVENGEPIPELLA